MTKKKSKNPSGMSIAGWIIGGAAVNTGAALKKGATAATKECLTGNGKSRKSVKKTAQEGLWSIFTG